MEMSHALRITALGHSLQITPVTKEDVKSRASSSVMPPHSSGQAMHVEPLCNATAMITPCTLPCNTLAFFAQNEQLLLHKLFLAPVGSAPALGRVHRLAFCSGSSSPVTQLNLRQPSVANAQRSHSEKTALCFQ